MGKKILLTEDRALRAALEHSFLCRGGFSLLTVADGNRAFEMIEEEDPALVLLDLDMTGMGGDTCCRRVKEDPLLRRTPVILVLRPDQRQRLPRCREAGCDELVFKPIDPRRLIDTACQLLHIVNPAAPRIVTQVPILSGTDRAEMRPGRILNLNGGGAFVASEHLFPIDTLLEMEFSLSPRGAPLRCRGRVAWVNHPEWIKAPELPHGMGVQFLEMEPEQAEVLRNFVEEQGRGNS